MSKFSLRRNKDKDTTEALPNEAPATTSTLNTIGESTRKITGIAHDALADTTEKAKSMLSKVSVDDFWGALGHLKKGAGQLGRNLTGEEFVNAAQKLLDRQMQYNNVLATRLAEALESIDTLKSRVSELEKKNEHR